MRKIQVWIAVVLMALVGMVATKNIIAKAAISGGVRAMTGLTLTIHAMDVGLINSAVGIRGLRLENPAGFSDRTMVDLSEIYVNYDLGAFLKQRVHLEEVRLDLSEFVVVKDQQGRVNLDALKVVQQSKGQPAARTPNTSGKAPEISIDALQLKIGTVVYKDYSRGGEPVVQEFPIHLHERYEHITNPQALAALIVSRALMNTTIARLINLDLNAIQGQLLDSARALQGTAKTTAQGAADTATDAVKQTTESLKKVLPFGN